MDVKIVDFAEVKVAALEHLGPPERVKGLGPQVHRMAQGKQAVA